MGHYRFRPSYRQNVGTAFAVYEAVQKNKPLVERIVTVTGDGVKQPGITG